MMAWADSLSKTALVSSSVKGRMVKGRDFVAGCRYMGGSKSFRSGDVVALCLSVGLSGLGARGVVSRSCQCPICQLTHLRSL